MEGVLALLNEGQELATFSSAQLRMVYKCIYEQVPRGNVNSLRRKLCKLNRETVLATVAAMVDEQLSAAYPADNERANSHCSASGPEDRHPSEPPQVSFPVLLEKFLIISNQLFNICYWNLSTIGPVTDISDGPAAGQPCSGACTVGQEGIAREAS